jgi:hypothetical protein
MPWRARIFLITVFFRDISRKKRDFKEYFEYPTEARFWIAVRNSFAFWLKKAETRFGVDSLDYKFPAFLERVADEGFRRALLDPDFSSDDIVGGSLLPTADYYISVFKRVMHHRPLFSREEWDAIPGKHKRMFSEDLLCIMDIDWQKEEKDDRQSERKKASLY